MSPPVGRARERAPIQANLNEKQNKYFFGHELFRTLTFFRVVFTVSTAQLPQHISHSIAQRHSFHGTISTGTEARKAGTDMYIFYLSKNERREDEIVSKSDVITIKNYPPNENHKKLNIVFISRASITPSGVLVKNPLKQCNKPPESQGVKSWTCRRIEHWSRRDNCHLRVVILTKIIQWFQQ